MKPLTTLVVYDPPRADLPFLAVTIAANGLVSAVPYATSEEADAHNRRVADELAKSTPKRTR